MALLFHESSFFRTAILLPLFLTLAGQLLGDPPLLSPAAASSPSQATPGAAGPQGREPFPRQPSEEESLPSLSQKQKRSLLKSNFEKMKRDAGDLADLAKALQEALNKSNENILSLDVIDKADKIEKLARKIKASARGF